MKRFIMGIILVMLASTWAAAASSVWEARKDGHIIYLGGTVHVLRPSDFPPPPEFDRAYKAADTLVFETDMGKLKDPAVQQLLAAKATYTDGSTIDKHLSPRTFQELSAYCAANGIPLAALRQFKPSLLIVTLTFLELKKLGVTEEGIDAYYYDRAKQDGKTIKGLETVNQQIDYLVTMADGMEDAFVSYSIEDMKGAGETFDALASAWRTGDAGKLNELMVAEMKDRWPRLYRKLITQRNNNWLPEIEALGKAPGTAFILVGAGHLVGPDGLIAALKRRGYRVERL